MSYIFADNSYVLM